MKTQRILSPVDGSNMSRFALMEADKLAAQGGGELTMMFVHEPATVHLMDDEFPEPEEMIKALLEKARKCMKKLAATLTIPEAKLHIVIERGSPAQTIVDHSAEYDLIVMSTHGHTGLKHLHLGSVAERVVRGSRCDVLVVKPEDKTD
jgi:universal stress protein A